MGASRLNARSVRRIARTTGLDVVFAWAHGGYWHNFCTREHRHGWWHRRTHEWEWDTETRWPEHYPDCYEWFDADGSFTLEQEMRRLANHMRERPDPRLRHIADHVTGDRPAMQRRMNPVRGREPGCIAWSSRAPQAAG